MSDTLLPTQLSDDGLIAETKRLAAVELTATAALVGALMELDARRLYLREGCRSLFTYCTQVLPLAEGAAYNRIEAARAAARFPQLLAALASGELNLTTLRLIATHLTNENVAEVLTAARYKSKRDVELLVATLNPRPATQPSVRKLPASSSSAKPSTRVSVAGVESASPEPALATVTATPAARPDAARTPLAVPLSPELYKVQFTVSRTTHDKLRRAQDLLRHAIPSGDPAEIFDRALTLLIEDIERRKLAAARKPRANAPSAAPHSRHIPARVRREVWKRAGGRCAFVGREGRCRETAFLEFHHVEPFAAGGAATVENIELRCRAHNAYEARLFFGGEVARERPDSFRNELASTMVDAPGWRNWQTLGT